ncbi:hypothetical protein [Rubritalea profundi]|uniref:hypothetical protein n=1 Tax=Rubritalea profundi TaxID=1658618 RepID=UPI001F0C6D5E|nr:hypothetical protein [Rubritalea profundi]
MKIALLTTDNREQQKRYDLEMPFFGTAPTALLAGMALLPEEVEVHVISCSKRKMNAPAKLAPNIFFYQHRSSSRLGEVRLCWLCHGSKKADTRD